jgi:hypothetical protein
LINAYKMLVGKPEGKKQCGLLSNGHPGAVSPGVKLPEPEANYSTASCGEIKNA